MRRSLSTVDILAQCAPALSLDELESIMKLNQAIEHAKKCAEGLHSTLDARARDLIITKLQEADHWCFELLRQVDKS
jgi:hypothetical protein